MRPMSAEPGSRPIAEAILRSDLYSYVQAIFPTVSPATPSCEIGTWKPSHMLWPKCSAVRPSD